MKYTSKGSGGRTWFQTLRTANYLRKNASLNFTLEGRLLVFDGIDRVRVKATEGASAGGETGPGLQIVRRGALNVDAGNKAVNVKIIDGPPLKLPARLSWLAAGHSRLLSWPVFLDAEGKTLPRGGGAVSSMSYSINYRGRRPAAVAIDYITSLAEIRWTIEVKDLTLEKPIKL